MQTNAPIIPNDIRPEQLPLKYRPLTAWNYFWYSILFSVPVVGFVFLIVFSFNGNNINRRSFARSYFCVALVWLIVMTAIFLTALYSGVMAELMTAI